MRTLEDRFLIEFQDYDRKAWVFALVTLGYTYHRTREMALALAMDVRWSGKDFRIKRLLNNDEGDRIVKLMIATNKYDRSVEIQ